MPDPRSRSSTKPREERSLASEPGLTAAIGPRAAADEARQLLGRGSLLIVSDFDGTLARLVTDPWGAVVIPAAQRALRRLAAAPGVDVALMSGRTVADLAQRARVGGVTYLGDHGAEWAVAPRGVRVRSLRAEHEWAAPAEAAMATLLQVEVPRAIVEPWLIVEAKGPAVTFHFRAAPDVDDARARVIAAVDGLDPDGLLVRSGGRRSVELRPAHAADKGATLRRLIDERRPGAAIMLGDDRSDALAFDALRRARSEGLIGGLAIAVAGHPDVSRHVAPRADLLLASPHEAAAFLGRLATMASRPSPVRASPAQSGRGLRSAPARPLRPPSSRGSPR